jgi:hypothetical protein
MLSRIDQPESGFAEGPLDRSAKRPSVPNISIASLTNGRMLWRVQVRSNIPNPDILTARFSHVASSRMADRHLAAPSGDRSAGRPVWQRITACRDWRAAVAARGPPAADLAPGSFRMPFSDCRIPRVLAKPRRWQRRFDIGRGKVGVGNDPVREPSRFVAIVRDGLQPARFTNRIARIVLRLDMDRGHHGHAIDVTAEIADQVVTSEAEYSPHTRIVMWSVSHG